MSETRGSTVLDCGCVVLLDFDRVGAFSRFTFEWCPLHSAAEEMRVLLQREADGCEMCGGSGLRSRSDGLYREPFQLVDCSCQPIRALLARLERTP